MTKTNFRLIYIILTLFLLSNFFCANKDKSNLHLYQNPSIPINTRVEDLLSKMTIEEKIGQMTQIDHTNITIKSDISKYGLGSILSGGNSMIDNNSAEGWANFHDELQSYALKSRLGIPVIYGIDALHGHNKVRGATIFPHNIGLGATRNIQLIEKIGRITAKEMAATGIIWTFSPCIAVPQDERWGRTYEGFSENTDLTSILGVAEINGYQGNNFTEKPFVLATAKHFGGDGGTKYGIDQGNNVLLEIDLRKIHLTPYINAIKNNVGSVMISYNSWNDEKVHGNKYLVNDVLKKEFGFKGLVVSDWAGHKHLPGNLSDQIERAINAGIDMIMVPDNYQQFINTTLELVKNKKISLDRIDESVRRILTIKFKLGLFENSNTNRNYLPLVGCKEHREVARDAVRQSLVLLKNNKILPLKKDIKVITVVGSKADDIGIQCGGWSINWQGYSGKITDGTSILEGIKNTVSQNTQVIFSEKGDKIKKSDAIIVVVGENPYAESSGDNTDLTLSETDKKLLKNVSKLKVPVIVILLSGRPLLITDEIKNCDAFIAVWLPGTEGEGISDVLFGDYKPTGKLSYTWPKNIEQLPINDGDGKKDMLFPYGFGLTY